MPRYLLQTPSRWFCDHHPGSWRREIRKGSRRSVSVAPLQSETRDRPPPAKVAILTCAKDGCRKDETSGLGLREPDRFGRTRQISPLLDIYGYAFGYSSLILVYMKSWPSSPRSTNSKEPGEPSELWRLSASPLCAASPRLKASVHQPALKAASLPTPKSSVCSPILKSKLSTLVIW